MKLIHKSQLHRIRYEYSMLQLSKPNLVVKNPTEFAWEIKPDGSLEINHSLRLSPHGVQELYNLLVALGFKKEEEV